MAENNISGRAVCVVYDGTGYGEDGTMWGGEIFAGDYTGFVRAGHLKPMLLPGGDAGIRHPWRMAIGALYPLLGSRVENLFRKIPENEKRAVMDMLAQDVSCVRTSGMGRLFDALSALLGICLHRTYEGQPAVMLEAAAVRAAAGQTAYDPQVEMSGGTGMVLIDGSKILLEALRDAHVKDFRSFFRRCTIDLPATDASQLSTPERVKRAEQTPDPQLAAIYFQFGRYLLISSSRPDSPSPANLQGIWADEYQTPWNGDFHLNINVQMNYWPAEVTGLGDCHEPLLRFVGRLVEPGRKTARAYYDAGGWVAHVVANPWLFTSPGEGASWGSTVTGGAWLCQHLWEHYAYSGDAEYLRQVYPTLKGASEFFVDFLVEEPRHKWLVTAPSNSPENAFRMSDGTLGVHGRNCAVALLARRASTAIIP
jgi:hypothetical protein